MRRAMKWVGIALGGGVGLFVLFVVLVLTGVLGPPAPSPQAIASSVDREPTLLAAARALPVAATYGEVPYPQANGSLCGPASLVNVYRSFGEEVADEAAILDGSGKCALGFCMMGLTLDELADVARGHSERNVTVLRDLSEEEFREHLRQSSDPARRYVINFSRAPIFGEGGGHHSPIGGYLEDEDAVLVYDTNAVYDGPWLVEVARLYAAMDTMDGDEKRGMLLIE